MIVFIYSLYNAFTIRLWAIKLYGRVIHEFDPWFNYRATEYLHQHGKDAFFKWFDHMSWYPLGRPVGTTIYPGLQFTAVGIHSALPSIGWPMSLNDVCVFMPAWFGCIATLFLGLLTWECTNSLTAGVWSMAIMSIIPAHIMRSVGGGFDNESIAVSAMCMVFYFWTRSLRNNNSWPFGIVTALAYFYMAAAWGGYIFVLNMVAFHAAILVVTSFTSGVDSYLTNLHRAYSLFYVFGTYGAMQVPVIGWTPLKSMEQLFALFVFFILQMVEFCQILKRRWNLTPDQLHSLRKKVVVVTGALAVVAIAVILPTGYFGPLSSRVRGLFVRHTRTGNPLVDSVAEHQPASAGAYMQYLYLCYFLSPFGLAFLYYSTDIIRERREARIFLISYALVAYYFSSKMSRLILLLGPIASALCGLALTRIFDWCYFQITQLGIEFQTTGFVAVEENVNDNAEKDKETKKVTKARKVKEAPKNDVYDNAKHEATEGWKKMYNQPSGKSWRLGGAVLIVLLFPLLARNFFTYCLEIAKRMSNPTIMYYGTIGEKQVLVDDYREVVYTFLPV